MDIDIIKWMVGYAKGFEIDGYQVTDPANFIYTLNDLKPDYRKDMWELIVYRLLLQGTIEGINSQWQPNGKYHIIQEITKIRVFELGSCDVKQFSIIDGDEAKEKALGYIHEQEK